MGQDSSEIEEIDLVIPFHENNKYLRESILSGLNSREVKIKVIAVDDTKNGIGELLRDEFVNANIEIVRSQSHGYLGAMKTGVASTKAKNVAFLDSDDLTELTRLKQQLNYIRAEKLDCCSSRIIRIDKNSRPLVSQGVLGSSFDNLDSEVRLLFGPYGADSSLLVSGDFLRENWITHSEFPEQFADYAWLLTNISKMKMKHLSSATYFYRTHESQMSRKKVETDVWVRIHPLWQLHLNSLAEKLPQTSRMDLSPEVSAAIAFPSSLPRLSRIHRMELRKFTKLFLKDARGMPISKSDIAAIRLRTLIGTRGRYISGFVHVPGMLIDLAMMLIFGNIPRKNS